MKFKMLVNPMKKAVNVLQFLVAGDASSQVLYFCEKGLRAMLGNLDCYDEQVQTSSSLKTYFKKNIIELAELDNKKDLDEQDIIKAREISFAVLEEMAVFMRETFLRQACGNVGKEVEEVLRYFEDSKLWSAMDGTLISDYYFVRLPIVVMSTLSTDLAQKNPKN